jgi:N-acetylglucosaminyldiphosphoundecaprenol N-acetyl-beta-D-mannosaminyltransferase
LRLLDLADARGWRLFLLGSRPETLSRVVAIVKERYPGLVVAGSRDGYFTSADEPGLVADIAAAEADMMFVGMGSPKQERFLADNLSAMNVPFAMGVGGSYNVLSGEFKRAPARVQRLGLEWLYRFVLDPKRLPRILSLPRFLGIVLRSPREHVDNIDFFGISISNRDIEELLDMADGFVESGVPHLVVTLNGEMAARAFRDAEFLGVVQQADLVVADGVGIVWGVRMLGTRIENRIPGIEFSGSLLALAERRGYRAYFLGAKPDIVERAASNATARYPGLNVVGFHSGYLDAAEEGRVIQEIRDGHVDILLVGMGGGAQEKWIWRHRDMGVPIAIGVGGTFDVWSGLVRRAPRFVQKTGTEWLYRLVVQPSRIRRVGSIFYFMFRVLAHRRTASRR